MPAYKSKSTFALFFGNRGFFPAALMKDARAQLQKVLADLGHQTLAMDEKATNYGAVETPDEGRRYAAWLDQRRAEIDGIILCLPNFGDENGAAEALRNAGVPIFIHAYPDDLAKLAAQYRRDSFCGKISIMDVFRQQGIKFTALAPHVVDPASAKFAANIDYFDRLCRVVSGLKNLRVGTLGARTTAFKTVRIDELALQKKGITVETYDLSTIITRTKAVDTASERYQKKAAVLQEYSSWTGVPDESFVNICKLGTVFDEIVEADHLDCLAVRCWLELQKELRISPCVLLSELNNRGVAAACETDIGSAVTMQALAYASGSAPACLDWNNNFGDDPEKCIVFHCGPVPQEMMREKGQIEDHQILSTAVGKGCGFGCNIGRIAPGSMTYGNLMSEDGRLRLYIGEGEFTNDIVPKEFFGTAGVVQIKDLQDVLLMVGNEGFRHHVCMSLGKVAAPLIEAAEKYLGIEVVEA